MCDLLYKPALELAFSLLLEMASPSGDGDGDDYHVKIVSKEVVVNALPLQEHRLPLSNLDMLVPPVSVSVFLCYKKPVTIPEEYSSFAEEATSHNLKSSLSDALVYYYAFAGRMVSNTSGEPELLCNNQGVEFVEACANIGLAELDFYNPDQTVEGKLVPKLSNTSVFATQVSSRLSILHSLITYMFGIS